MLEITANENVALDVGQLVKDEYFTLFESIGAIEVGSSQSLPRLINSHNKDYGPQDGQWLSTRRRDT